MGKLDFKIDKKADGILITMTGVIDEDADFGRAQIAGAKKIELHLSGVKSINSCGIRDWIKWMSQAGTAEIQWIECPKVIVDQVNMVDGFLPTNARVVSFYVPYFNESLGEEKNVLYRLGTEYKDKTVQHPVVKGGGGEEFELDVIESKYFKFITK